MKGVRVYCMMATGKPTTEHLMEVLFVNAYEMWDEQKERQEIRSRRYVGFISSNMQVFQHMGVPCIEFESVVTETQEKWGVNQIRYIVRIDDLNVPPNIAFGKIAQMEGPPMPIPMDFMAMEEGDDDDDESDFFDGSEYDLGNRNN
jgi:hypothetical protein